MAAERIPERKELPEEYTWDLSAMYPDDGAWMEEYEKTAELPERLESFRGKLGESADALLSYLRLDDKCSLRVERLLGYASCKNDQDLANSAYKDMRGKAISRLVSISSASAFATPEIIAIPEERLASFYGARPELETYRRTIYRLRRRAKHILSPAEERLLAAAGEMADSPDAICGTFRNADLKFPEVEDSHGEKHPLSAGTYVPLMESGDRTLRKNAFFACYGRYGEFKNTVAASLDAQFKQLRFFSEARKYPGTLSASLDRTEVPEQVYMNLIEAVHGNLDKMYRYVALRKRALGLDELHMYDVLTPIVRDTAVKISYDEAKKTVLEALSVLGEDYTALLEKRASASGG